MITMKDPSLTVYPNREQMLALIQARGAAGTEDCADVRRSAEPEPPSPTCIFFLED
jgi:hypothetical protein